MKNKILDDIIEKAGLAGNADALEIRTFIENAYLGLDEEVLEKYISMLDMLYPLSNYHALIKEYCPSSLKNNQEYQKTAGSFIGYLRRTLSKA